jgi:hypothetical protein
MTTTLCSAPTSPLLTPEQTAGLLDTTTAELAAQRAAGVGPTHHSIWMGTVRYDTASVMQWRSQSETSNYRS